MSARGVRAVRRTAMAAIFCSLPSCIDLFPVSPPPDRPAILNVSLRLADIQQSDPGAGALVTLSASLDAGVDEVGRDRTILDDTLRVFGSAVPPIERQGGRALYAETLPLEAAELFAGDFPVQTPLLDGLGRFEVQVRWPLLSRAAPVPDTIQPGEELRLPLRFTAFPGEPVPSSRRWSIAVFRPDGWFSQGAETVPPAIITVPASLLGAPGSELLAAVNYSQFAQVPGAGGEYLLRLELSQELRWSITVAPQADPESAPADLADPQPAL
jgi:hypothetical protein